MLDKMRHDIMMTVNAMRSMESVRLDGSSTKDDGTHAINMSKADCDPTPIRNDRIGC